MKVQIDLPQETHQKLKEEAQKHYQSLRAYIVYHLVQYADHPDKFMDTSILPEGTTFKTTTPKIEKDPYEGLSELEKQDKIQEEREQKFLALAKRILPQQQFEELEENGEYKFFKFSDHTYYKYAEPVLNEDGTPKFVRNPWNMPEEKQIQYLNELKA